MVELWLHFSTCTQTENWDNDRQTTFIHSLITENLSLMAHSSGCVLKCLIKIFLPDYSSQFGGVYHVAVTVSAVKKKSLHFPPGKNSGTKSPDVLETVQVVMDCPWMLLLQSAASRSASKAQHHHRLWSGPRVCILRFQENSLRTKKGIFWSVPAKETTLLHVNLFATRGRDYMRGKINLWWKKWGWPEGKKKRIKGNFRTIILQ